MTMLALSLLALVLGPVLHYLSRKSDAARAALDGFVYVAIAGLVLVQILPEALALSGWAFLLPCLVGMLGPLFTEQWLVKRGPQAHAAAVFIGLLGLGIHNAVDGVALLDTGAGPALGIAVALHQIPVGLMIWFLIRPNFGRGMAIGVIGALCIATAAGYFCGAGLHEQIESRWSGYLQALVGGSLLHVVGHGAMPVHGVSKTRLARFAGVGGLVGLLLVVLVVGPHHHEHAHAHEHDGLAEFTETALALAYASAPSLLLGYVLAGIVQAFLPKATSAWMSRGSAFSQALRGVVFGLPLPVCSCGVVPIYRSLVMKGAAPAAAISFLIATPELGIDAMLLSLPLLGKEMAIARIAAATVTALAVGWIMGGFDIVKKKANLALAVGNDASTGPKKSAMFVERLLELFDSTSPWIILGLAVAALLDPLIRAEWLPQVPPLLQLPLAAAIGMPLYVCASGATPLVAMLLAKGLSPGAALVFLLTGPATNVTTFGLVSKMHGRRAAIVLTIAIFSATLAAGFAVNLWLGTAVTPPAFAGGAHEHEAPGWLERAALITLGCGVLLALVRHGPREYFGQIGATHHMGDADGARRSHHHGHDHGHGHHHGHAHAHGPAGECGHGDAHDHAGHDHDPHPNGRDDGPNGCCGQKSCS